MCNSMGVTGLIIYDDVEEEFNMSSLLLLLDMGVGVVRCDGVDLTEKLRSMCVGSEME